jgi:hypothetical protein
MTIFVSIFLGIQALLWFTAPLFTKANKVRLIAYLFAVLNVVAIVLINLK